MWHFIVFDVIFPIFFIYICNSQNNFIFLRGDFKEIRYI